MGRGPDPLRRSAHLLRRLRGLSNSDRARFVAWSTGTAANGIIRRESPPSVTAADLHRWFGAEPPVLYHPLFGRVASGPKLSRNGKAESPASPSIRADPRLEWEGARDQDLAGVVTDAIANGWDQPRSVVINNRFERALNASMPNAMEAALRSVTWFEVTRFRMTDPTFSLRQKRVLALWLLRNGAFIERRLHEVPLGGNHLLTHAAGLLYIGRLMPGLACTDRWAKRGERILHSEVLRQFHADGGTYEQSTAYHLFALDVVLSYALLLRGQGVSLPNAVAERIRTAARFAAAIARPDGSIPILGDDDSGRFHRWGDQPAVRELCSLGALLLDDPDLAVAADGSSSSAAWLNGSDAPSRLNALASRRILPVISQSFVRTGLHILRAPDWHAAVWSRDPTSPAMLSHGHSDHNSIDVWCCGDHLLRDPGTGVYVGDPAVRNRLRATDAHSTLTLDGLEVNKFEASDLFFMPPSTRGRRVEWFLSDRLQSVTTTHDGFRHERGRPTHVRRVRLDVAGSALEVWDEVGLLTQDRSRHSVQGWWHWGAEPSKVRREVHGQLVRWRFRVFAVNVELDLPTATEFVISEPYPWSPRYGVLETGRRSVVKYRGLLPFRMALRLYRAEESALT